MTNHPNRSKTKVIFVPFSSFKKETILGTFASDTLGLSCAVMFHAAFLKGYRAANGEDGSAILVQRADGTRYNP